VKKIKDAFHIEEFTQVDQESFNKLVSWYSVLDQFRNHTLSVYQRHTLEQQKQNVVIVGAGPIGLMSAL
jgi:NADPH-dependent 2,4-dienoyl-CoA reductase/sulfur reductase-like enzyme